MYACAKLLQLCPVFETLQTVANQLSLSIQFSRQENRRGVRIHYKNWQIILFFICRWLITVILIMTITSYFQNYMAPGKWLKIVVFMHKICTSGSFNNLLSFFTEGRQTENHNHRKLTNLITRATALSNSMKLWAMLYGATQDRHVMVESSDKAWSTGEGNGKPLQYSCLENPI